MSLLWLSGINRSRRPVAYVLIFGFLLLTAFNLYKNPIAASAGVSVNGDDVTISSGVYTIDDDGYIYSDPGISMTEKDANGNAYDLPKEFYSYLFNPMYNASGSRLQVSSITNLTIEAGAVVIMEGSQKFNNLTVRGEIKQPYPGRDGIINKPIFTSDNWGVRLTGFIKLAPGMGYRISNRDDQSEIGHTQFADDTPVAIETSSSDTISASTSWTLIYRYEGASNGNVTGWKNRVVGGDSNRYSSELSNATSSDKYVPIRVSIANMEGSSNLQLRIKSYPLNNILNETEAPATKSVFYGKADSGLVDSAKDGLVQFEYFVSEEDLYPRYGFSNCARTATKEDLDLHSDLINFGDNDPSPDTRDTSKVVDFVWYGSVASPFGENSVNVFQKRASLYSHRDYNTKAFDAVRRIVGGLTIEVNGATTLEGAGKIALSGMGYPGVLEPIWGANPPRGGGRGGGYSSYGCNGATATGASHAGKGGYNLNDDNHCRRYTSSPDIYGSADDPNTLGSGGGGATDYNGGVSVSGSGGGLLRLVTGDLTIKGTGMIDVSGSPGIFSSWHTNTGGSGGSANIVVKGSFNPEATGTIISAAGSSGKVSDAPLHDYIGGGGGYILLKYASSNVDQTTIEGRLSVDGGDGGRGSNTTTGGEDWDGGDGIITLDGSLVSGASLNIVKETFNASGESEATFEPGDVVQVKLRIYEPGTSRREDFKIEDKVNGSFNAGSLKLEGAPISGGDVNFNSSSGSLQIKGSDKTYLNPGEINEITYQYTL